MQQRVAILGASNKPERYAYRELRALLQHGHIPLPVSPALTEIDGISVSPRLADTEGPIDTLTMYVGPKISTALASEIVACRPGRVIFNPGSRNEELFKILRQAGIPAEEACTLVLLQTGQF